MNTEIKVKGIVVPFPDELEDALLSLRGAGVHWAFDVGRLTAAAVDEAFRALDERGYAEIDDDKVRSGIVGKIIAHVGRLIGRSSSRVRRYYDLWRAFGDGGSTGVNWRAYEAVGLSHWEAALGLRSQPDLLREYLDTVMDYPTEKPDWCLQQALEALDMAEPQPQRPAANAMVDEIIEAIAEGREPAIDEVDLEAVLQDKSARIVVVNTLMKAVDMVEAALPVLRSLPGVIDEQIQVAESAVDRLRALLTTIVAQDISV